MPVVSDIITDNLTYTNKNKIQVQILHFVRCDQQKTDGESGHFLVLWYIKKKNSFPSKGTNTDKD